MGWIPWSKALESMPSWLDSIPWSEVRGMGQRVKARVVRPRRSIALPAVVLVGCIVGAVAWWQLPRGATVADPCPTAGGHLGWVQPPAPFLGQPGETWIPESDAEVRAERREGRVVCVLGSGTPIVLLNEGIDPQEPWIRVHAEAILPPKGETLARAEAAREAEPASAPPPERMGGLCPGPVGTIVGYAKVPQPFLVPKGGTWTVLGDRVVVGGHPAPANGYRSNFEVVCRLRRGARVVVHQKPIRIRGHGTWVPIYAGAAKAM